MALVALRIPPVPVWSMVNVQSTTQKIFVTEQQCSRMVMLDMLDQTMDGLHIKMALMLITVLWSRTM